MTTTSITEVGKECKVKMSAKAKKSLSKMMAKIQNGDLSPLTLVVRFQPPEDSPVTNWTYRNQVLAFAQTGRLDCRGYNQWKQADRQVKKGERGGWIFAPRQRKVKDDDGNEKWQFCGYRLISVFADTSTDGDEPLPEYQPKELPPLADVAKKMGVDVSYGPMAGALGDCTTDGKKIRLGTPDEKVFFHELTHAAHAKIDDGLNGGQQVGQETVAEFTAIVLMDLFGLEDRSGNAWSYISHYSKDPLKAFLKAVSKVEEVLELLFSDEGNNNVS